jgi:hypothetical protein
VIYLFTGPDAGRTRAKAFQWVAAARAKAPDAPYTRIAADNVTAEALSEAVSARGLFYAKSLTLIDDPFSLAESGDLVLEHLKDLADSENIVAVLAPKLLAAKLKKLEAKAEKVFLVEAGEKKPARGFNGALVSALGNRDGALLWKELLKAERAGDVPEMLHGLLHWKARDMMQKGGPKWTKQEARVLSRNLIELLSDSRGGELSLGDNLERFALSLSQ